MRIRSARKPSAPPEVAEVFQNETHRCVILLRPASRDTSLLANIYSPRNEFEDDIIMSESVRIQLSLFIALIRIIPDGTNMVNTFHNYLLGASDRAARLEERMINVCERSRIVNVWRVQCRAML